MALGTVGSYRSRGPAARHGRQRRLLGSGLGDDKSIMACECRRGRLPEYHDTGRATQKIDGIMGFGNDKYENLVLRLRERNRPAPRPVQNRPSRGSRRRHRVVAANGQLRTEVYGAGGVHWHRHAVGPDHFQVGFSKAAKNLTGNPTEGNADIPVRMCRDVAYTRAESGQIAPISLFLNDRAVGAIVGEDTSVSDRNRAASRRPPFHRLAAASLSSRMRPES